MKFEAGAIDFDPPLGKTSPRTVRFPNGAKFYTEDSDKLDTLRGKYKVSFRNPQVLASLLENHRQAIVISILILAAFVFVAYKYGIPAVADSVAKKVPRSVLETVSDNTLETLDKYFGFAPSNLPEERRGELLATFDQLIFEIGSPEYSYKLEFRDIPPNAFALPSGTIIFSDSLIEELVTEEAIIAVMAHEVAHVEERHGMRQVLRQAGVAFLVSTLLSDVSSLPAILSALPELLISSGYSRSFESEADAYSADYLCHRYGSSQGMVDALERLQSLYGMAESESTEFISTHPLLSKRIEMLEELGCE
ncbi:MAG: M48 family metallopeptidase [Verrucomicrobiota bacterium]